MRARQVLEPSAAPHSSATRDAMLEAFDEAWSIVLPTSGSDPMTIGRLAN